MNLVNTLKENQQDFEFYPTTDEIIGALLDDLRDLRYKHRCDRSVFESILDIGAGNGKVLSAIIGGEDLPKFEHHYAIEKSPMLAALLPKSIRLMGTDFWEQSLHLKEIGIIYSNPPYKEFVAWSDKLIRESPAQFIYLLIPSRWKDNRALQDAITFRDAKAEVIGTFDFLDAEDRSARAYVDLIRIKMTQKEDEAFRLSFMEQFGDLYDKFDVSKHISKEKPEETSWEETVEKGLTTGASYPEVLVNLYIADIQHIQENYQSIGKVDPSILSEFGVDLSTILSHLKDRLTNLRQFYWKELFARFDTITKKLTSKTRDSLVKELNEHLQMDFTLSNIHSVVLWVIQNFNDYVSQQLIETYEKMVTLSNVHRYKSNERVWSQDRWRYNRLPEDASHYALEYRIVITSVGALSTWSYKKGLSDSAAIYLEDLLTIANNLGFTCDTQPPSLNGERKSWVSNKPFFFEAQKEEESPTFNLMKVRAFQNGNLHIHLDKNFALALNVEYGRLKGWIKNAAEAVEELNDPKAADFFQSNLQLSDQSPLLLLG